MTDRDTLAALIRPHLDGGTLPDHLVGGMAAGWQAEQIADAVLAAGWRAPETHPEKLTTVKDELAGYSRDHLIDVAKLLNPDGLPPEIQKEAEKGADLT